LNIITSKTQKLNFELIFFFFSYGVGDLVCKERMALYLSLFTAQVFQLSAFIFQPSVNKSKALKIERQTRHIA